MATMPEDLPPDNGPRPRLDSSSRRESLRRFLNACNAFRSSSGVGEPDGDGGPGSGTTRHSHGCVFHKKEYTVPVNRRQTTGRVFQFSIP